VADRIGAGVDREHARVFIVGAPEPVCGVDEDATSGRSEGAPPRSGDREPQKPDLQVAIAGVPSPLGRLDDPRRAVSVAEVGRVDHLLHPSRARALDRQLLLADLAQQPRCELRLTKLDGKLARREESASSVRRITELGRPSQCSHGHVESAASERTPPRVFELQGDVFVRLAHQGGAVPDTAVGIAVEDSA
jgi:hypothetical protein